MVTRCGGDRGTGRVRVGAAKCRGKKIKQKDIYVLNEDLPTNAYRWE